MRKYGGSGKSFVINSREAGTTSETINCEASKKLRLWPRRKRGNRKLECSGCGRRIEGIAEVYERKVRDLPWSQYRTTVVIELYRVRCPDCGDQGGESGVTAQ